MMQFPPCVRMPIFQENLCTKVIPITPFKGFGIEAACEGTTNNVIMVRRLYISANEYSNIDAAAIYTVAQTPSLIFNIATPFSHTCIDSDYVLIIARESYGDRIIDYTVVSILMLIYRLQAYKKHRPAQLRC